MKKDESISRYPGSGFVIKRFSFICFYFLLLFYESGGQSYYPGINPGKAIIEKGEHSISLKNNVLSLSVDGLPNELKSIRFINRENNEEYLFANDDFPSIVLLHGDSLALNQFRVDSVTQQRSGIDKNGPYFKIGIALSNIKYGISLNWELKLNDQSNYVSHNFNFRSGSTGIAKIYTLRISEKYKPKVFGQVDGSPVVAGNAFFAVENPMFQVNKAKGAFDLYVLPLAGQVNGSNIYEESMAWGCFPEGQLRRGFLYYLEKARAVPYRQLTFYDSWYDLSYDLNVLTEENCIDRIKTWGDSLKERGAGLDCFLWDSGWDDWYNMWEFNKKLPQGFSNINAFARRYNASSGAWLSPWGGYDEFIKVRLATAKEHFPQYKINEHGFTLTDPNYYTYFKDVIINLIRQNNVTLFKIDGIDPGKYNPDCSGFGIYADEMHAFIQLIKKIREVKPDIRLNLTVGTWPSPFWLCYGDNIWKGGDDFGALGEGNHRQQWMNFRDYGVFKCTAKSPLCPISSLMFHGITIANYGATAGYEMDDRFISDDIWTYFSNGTSLQELYINPHKLSKNNWDELAKAMKWSRIHKGVLVDSHWVGGDPSRGEVYGFASWNPQAATLMIRNPSSRPADFTFSLNELLELPKGFDGMYRLFNVRSEKEEGQFNSLQKGTIHLSPFEVKVMNVSAQF